MRKALLGLILAALFVGGPVVVASPQTSGNAPPASQGTLADLKAVVQDAEDVIYLTETQAKPNNPPEPKPAATAPASNVKPQAQAEPPPRAEPQPKVDPQQVENLKILRDQLREKIRRAEQARNPAEAQVLLKDALLQAEAVRSLQQSVVRVPPGPAGVVERTIMLKFGSKALEQVRAIDQGFRGIRNNDGAGGPSSHTIYDVARPRAGFPADPVNPRPDRLMQGSFASGSTPSVGNFRPATIESARGAVQQYGSQFGGVVLEGTGAGLPSIYKLEYNRMANALVANDRAVYFSPVSARALAILARAIAQDERIGVSLGSTHVVTKSLPPESEVALDLKIADHFLGDIVFAKPEWTRGYRFRDGFEPKPHAGNDFDVAVYFIFNGFAFAIDGEELRSARVGFDVSLVPLSNRKASDGGHLPDEDAILRGIGSAQYEENARHIARNIDYYRREKLIEIVFAYGEVAALLRATKNNGLDLVALAGTIETANGFTAADAARSTPAPASRPVAAAPAAPAGPSLWDHNNSVMSLEASGATRRIYYRQPREGMLRAGAQPGSLLFDGRQSGRQIAGTAYIFAGSCGQKPYQVQGEVRDDGSIVMHGLAPRINRSTCQPIDTRADELVFTPRGAPAAAASGSPAWDHNGSAMSLQVSGSTVRFLYQQPRPGMLQAGAQPGSLLFDGQRSGTQIWGTAYVFSRSCGPQPYAVQGEIVDNGVVMRGAAPRMDPRTCTLVDTRPDELVFRPRQSAPRPEVVQMHNHWAAYLKRIQERNQYPNWSAPPYDLYQGSQTGRG